MIRVIYSELDGPEGLTLRLEASGHAGYAPAGQDIVCAGASTLMQALVSLLAGEKTARSDAWDEPEGPRLAVTAAAPQEPVSYTHLRAHETDSYLVCRLLLEKKKKRTHLSLIHIILDRHHNKSIYDKISMSKS